MHKLNRYTYIYMETALHRYIDTRAKDTDTDTSAGLAVAWLKRVGGMSSGMGVGGGARGSFDACLLMSPSEKLDQVEN